VLGCDISEIANWHLPGSPDTGEACLSLGAEGSLPRMHPSRRRRGVPFIGGIVVVITDAWMMRRIAEQAMIEFPAENSAVTSIAHLGLTLAWFLGPRYCPGSPGGYATPCATWPAVFSPGMEQSPRRDSYPRFRARGCSPHGLPRSWCGKPRPRRRDWRPA